MGDIILKVNGLSKYYESVKALDNISFEIKRGEIHGLCGENGAGKSTFIKLLTGANEPSAGTIEFEGTAYKKLTPKMAMDFGIAVIYQEFSLIPYLTVVENIFYGREIQKFGIRNIREMDKQAKQLCRDMGVDLDIHAKVCNLGVAYQQIVEILKAVSQNAKFMIMDEPTAPLTTNETALFFNIIKKLKEKNVTIIFISHRLEEVFELCSRVTVFCDGRFMVTKEVGDITRKQLISYMVGRELAEDYPAPSCKPGSEILKVSSLSNRNIRDISFTLRRGEILGIGGLVGAGRTELAHAVFGADSYSKGEMQINGKPYHPRSPKDALKRGIGLIPEDRKKQGIVRGMSVKENITYSVLPSCAELSVISKRREKLIVDQYIRELKIKTSGDRQLVKNLSGGNQQKVVLAKMLATNCDILIFDEPTRGIDVGAKQEIYHLMCALAEQGKALIMISSEMPELIGMSSRILVMGSGRITGELERSAFSQERILEQASGEREKGEKV